MVVVEVGGVVGVLVRNVKRVDCRGFVVVCSLCLLSVSSSEPGTGVSRIKGRGVVLVRKERVGVVGVMCFLPDLVWVREGVLTPLPVTVPVF